MKYLVCLFALLGLAYTLEDVFEQEVDWSKIRPHTAYIDPLPNATYSKPEGRVVGGSEVTRNSIPFQVALVIDSSFFCGASVISNGWVLTAAHCTIRAAIVQMRFGAHNVQQTEATQLVITSNSIINHQNYVASTLANDIALIRSPSTISFNANIQPVSLAPASSGNFAGSTAVISGWGRTSDSSSGISPVLRSARANVITNAICGQTYGNSIIIASTICTSGAGNVGACQGDSGGPLVVNGVQVGVTSFVSSRGCQQAMPSGFARVSSFRSWITSISGV